MKRFLVKLVGLALVFDALSAFASGVPVLSPSSSKEEVAAWFSAQPEKK